MVDSEIKTHGVVTRRRSRVLGMFLDGPALDRASKRMGRKIDLKALVREASSGLTPAVLRYYTLIPNEDDSRQRSFLSAVSAAGFETVVKRLPPKGVAKQVSIDVELSADLVAFSHGRLTLPRVDARESSSVTVPPLQVSSDDSDPAVVIICPSKELTYPLSLLKEMKIDVSIADFMKPGTSDLMKVCRKWVDLSDAETIWRS
jgi:uncharacterized LabA/DUF88 family protein